MLNRIFAITLFVAAPVFAQGQLVLIERKALETSHPWRRAAYVSADEPILVGRGGISNDNGRTWQPYRPCPDFDSHLPYGYRRTPLTMHCDPQTDRVVQIVNAMDTPGLDPTINEPPSALRNYYLRYRVSLDNARTWIIDEPIIQGGKAFDASHPIPGVTIGQNAVFLGDQACLTITTRDGKLLVPAHMTVTSGNGELANPGGGHTWTDVVILVGAWRPDARIDWEASKRIAGDPTRTVRGVIEPTLAEMPDGRILVVMRGGNGGPKDPKCELPAHKWFSVSRDGGYTWTKPQPWRYTDGTAFYSPSSMSQLLMHSSGRIFWIGNINDENCCGNNPRNPLVIGEVDTESMMLIRDSILVIDKQQPDDPAGGGYGGVYLSPHGAAIEDRETGEIVLAMPRYLQEGTRRSTATPYIYRIAFAE